MNRQVLKSLIPQDQRTYNNFFKLFYSKIEADNKDIYNEYFNKKFYLLSDRIDGLGGRITGLYSLIYFAKVYKDYFNSDKITIILHWIRNDGMGANFYDLFDVQNNNLFEIIEDTNFTNPWKLPHDKYLPDYPRIYREIKDLEYYRDKKAIHNRKYIDSMYDTYDYNNIKLWKNKTNFYINEYITVKKHIKESADKLLENKDISKLIGLHIRTSDLKKLNLEYYANFIQTYGLQNYIFIVASQDNDDINFFRHKFPNTTFIKQYVKINSICDPKEKLPYYNLGYYDNQTRKEIMYYDMIDYYLLSLCSVIITNSRNTLNNNKEVSSFIKNLLMYGNRLVISLFKNSNCNNLSSDIKTEIMDYL